MNLLFKWVMFGIFISLGTGLTLLVMPDDYVSTCFVYDTTLQSQLDDNFGGVINPNNNVEDQSSSFIRLIDSLNLGVIGKIISGVNTFLYGILDYGKCLFGYYSLTGVAKATYDSVNGILQIALSIAYIWAAVYMWTGRKTNK